MNKRFLSAVLFGAFMVTSTGTFVSCKDYDDDIKGLQEQINTVVKDLADLKKQIGDKGVTSVTFDEATGVLTVVTGGESKTYTIKTPASGVQNIVMDGNSLIVDGKPIGEFKPGDSVSVSEEGELLINKKGTGIFVGKSAIITDKTSQKVTIKLPNANGEMEEVTLAIYNPANAITGLSFISVNSSSAAATNYAISWGKATAALAWDGAKGAIAKDQLLVGTINDLYVQVMPASVDLSAIEIELVASDGTVAPVTATATPFEGVITRAASANGVWKLNIAPNASINADNISKSFKTNNGKSYGFALKVGGNILSGYDTKVEESQIGETSLASTDITYAGTVVATAKVPFGKSVTLDYAANKAYDAYLTPVSASALELAGVAINGKTMTFTSTEAAAGKTVSFNVVFVDYTGKKKTLSTVSVTFEGATVDPETPIATVDYTATDDVKAVVMNAGTVFTSLTAAQAEALKAAAIAWNVVSIDGKTIATSDQATANGKFVFAMDQAKYYKNLNNGAGKDEVKLTSTTSVDDVRAIKYIIFEGTYQSNVTPGAYTLNLTFTKGSNQLKKIAATVNVALPAFDQLFTKVTSAWNADQTVLNALLNASASADVAKKYVMTNALKVVVNSNADWNNLTLTPKTMKIDGKDEKVAEYAYPNLSMIDKLLNDKGVVRGNVTVDGAYLVDGKANLQVKMTSFAVNFYSPFQGAAFKYYTNGAVSTGKVAVAIDGSGAGTIAKNVVANGKANGLALQVLNDEQAVSNALDFFGTTATNYDVKVVGDAVPAGATATLTDAGIALAGMNTGVYDANVVVTVTALNGIKTVVTLPIATK